MAVILKVGISILLSGFFIGLMLRTLSMIPADLEAQELLMSGIYSLPGVAFEKAVVSSYTLPFYFLFNPFFL